MDLLLTPEKDVEAVKRLADTLTAWIVQRIKDVTGDDLTGKTEEELTAYFGDDKPIIVYQLTTDTLTMQYRGRNFTTPLERSKHVDI